MVGVRVGILPHGLRVDEEHNEGDRHQYIVTSHVQDDRLLEVHLNVHITPDFNNKFSACKPGQEYIPLVKVDIAAVFDDKWILISIR